MTTSTTQTLDDIFNVLQLDKTIEEYHLLYDSVLHELDYDPETADASSSSPIVIVCLWKQIIDQLYQLRRNPSSSPQPSIQWSFYLSTMNQYTDSYHYYYLSLLILLCKYTIHHYIPFPKYNPSFYHAFHFNLQQVHDVILTKIRPCLYLMNQCYVLYRKEYIWNKVPTLCKEFQYHYQCLRSIAFFLDGCYYSLSMQWLKSKEIASSSVKNPEAKEDLEAIKSFSMCIHLCRNNNLSEDNDPYDLIPKLIKSSSIMIGLIQAHYARKIHRWDQAKQIYDELTISRQWILDEDAIENTKILNTMMKQNVPRTQAPLLLAPTYPDDTTLSSYTDCSTRIMDVLPTQKLTPIHSLSHTPVTSHSTN